MAMFLSLPLQYFSEIYKIVKFYFHDSKEIQLILKFLKILNASNSVETILLFNKMY